MQDDWKEEGDLLASATSCPAPDCGALTISYRWAPRWGALPELWEFTCPRCGIDFAATREELVFQSVPKQWLQPGTHFA